MATISVCERKLLERIHDYYTKQIFHAAVITEIRREKITRVIRQVRGKLEHKMPRQNYSLIHVLPRRRVTDNTTNQRHRKEFISPVSRKRVLDFDCLTPLQHEK
jgi:hypothetical protein